MNQETRSMMHEKAIIKKKQKGFPVSWLLPPASSSRGVALISVVVIMLTIAIIGASLVELISSVNYSSDLVLNKTKARYLAEAGIAQAMHILRDKTTQESLTERFGPVPLGDGTYTIIFDFTESMITSVGKVNGITKKLQLQYNVF